MPVEGHQRLFKNAGKSGEELRRRRAEGSVELRKSKKDENLMKRRNVDLTENDGGAQDDLLSSPEDPGKKTGKSEKVTLSLSECMQIFAQSGKGGDLRQAVESVRRHLSRQSAPNVDEVIEMGFLPFLVEALRSKDTKIQFESAWALTNVCSGTSEQTRHVVSVGALRPLVDLLRSDALFVAEQACWALGNVAGDCAQLRDFVIDAGAVKPLIALCHKQINIDFLRTLTWTLSNLCRNKNPMPPDWVIGELLTILPQLTDHSDQVVASDACWGMAYMSDGPDERIDLILDRSPTIIDQMVKLLGSNDVGRVAPALRCLGNIVTGSDQQTQMVIDSGVLKTLIPAILNSGKPVIVKEAMWLVSNIAAGNRDQIQAILEANMIPLVLEVIKKGDFRSQFEACWIVNNLTSGGTTDQIAFLLRFDIFPPLCDCLKAKESKMISLVLDCLLNLLGIADKMDQLEKATIAVEECGGLDKIEELQNHPNEDIYRKALGLIQRYFHDDDDADEQTGITLNEESRATEHNFDNPSAPLGRFAF